jgi:hypothetical protein
VIINNNMFTHVVVDFWYVFVGELYRIDFVWRNTSIKTVVMHWSRSVGLVKLFCPIILANVSIILAC